MIIRFRALVLVVANSHTDRVLYTGVLAGKVAALASRKDTPLSSADRVGLVMDTIAFAKAGLTTIGDALTFLEHFRNDDDGTVPPWPQIALTNTYNPLSNRMDKHCGRTD